MCVGVNPMGNAGPNSGLNLLPTHERLDEYKEIEYEVAPAEQQQLMNNPNQHQHQHTFDTTSLPSSVGPLPPGSSIKIPETILPANERRSRESTTTPPKKFRALPMRRRRSVLASPGTEDPFLLSKMANASKEEDGRFVPDGSYWAVLREESKITAMATTTRDDRILVAVGLDLGGVRLHYHSNAKKKDDEDEEEWKKVCVLLGEGKVRALDFSPTGTLLAVAGDDCRVTIHRLYPRPDENGVWVEQVCCLERADRVYAVRFHPHGTHLAVGGFDGMVAVAAIVHGPDSLPMLDVVRELSWHGLVLSVDWSPGTGQYLAVGGNDRVCGVFEVQDWELVGEIHRGGMVGCVRWHPTGTSIAVGSHDGSVAVVGVDSRGIEAEMLFQHSNDDNGKDKDDFRINSMDWSPHGDYLAVAGTDDCCRIVETESYMTVQEFKRSQHVNAVVWNRYKPKQDDEHEIQHLAIAGNDKSVVILRMEAFYGKESETSSSVAKEDDDDDDDDNDACRSELSASASVVGSEFLPQHEWVLKDDLFHFDDLDARKRLPSSGSSSRRRKQAMAKTEKSITSISFSRGKPSQRSDVIAIATSDNDIIVYSTIDWGAVAVSCFLSKQPCVVCVCARELLC